MAFDISKHVVSREVSDVVLPVGEDALNLKVRALPWSKKKQIVSQCIHWDKEGNTRFDSDSYTRECLKYMIVDAPWGATTDIFLTTLDDALGMALDSLVPMAFAGGASTQSPSEIKKEL